MNLDSIDERWKEKYYDKVAELVACEKERDEYVHEAEHFQNKCIDLDQANGMLKAENERLKTALQEVADYPVSDYGGVIARKALGIPE